MAGEALRVDAASCGSQSVVHTRYFDAGILPARFAKAGQWLACFLAALRAAGIAQHRRHPAAYRLCAMDHTGAGTAQPHGLHITSGTSLTPVGNRKEADMPWKESCAMDERAGFCQQVMEGDLSIAELCRAFGISRVTGYKWIDRYQSGGVAALADQSRARHTQPQAYSQRICDMVIRARIKHPTWGAKKIRPWLAKRHPHTELPATTTMETMLRDAGLVRARRRSRRFEGSMGDPAGADRPNGVWSVDFKGEFRLGDGSYCYPLTVFDNYSRYLLSCDALCSTRFEPTWTAFHRLFGKQGLPDRIRSDNGSPFTSCGHGRLSRLSVYWMSLGIEVERTRPGRPQDNGRHERMHRTLKQDTARPPTNTKPGQQRRFNEFRRKYNQERPHEALDMKCPCEFYEASTRPYEQVEYEYPGYWEVRKISRMGQIAWKGRQLFLSEALIGHRVGLVEIDDGIWKVSFRQLPLARLIDRRGSVRIEPLRPRVWG